MTDLNTLLFSKEHEWVALEGDVATVGITDFAAESLGDVVFLELPAVGTELTADTVVGEIESTKSVSDFYAPVSGIVVEVNAAAVDDPAVVNAEPFEGGWLLKVSVAPGATEGLLDRAAYVALTQG